MFRNAKKSLLLFVVVCSSSTICMDAAADAVKEMEKLKLPTATRMHFYKGCFFFHSSQPRR